MSKNLLELSQKGITKSAETTSVDCIIKAIKPTKIDGKVAIETDKGTFFPYTNQFPNGKLPMVGKGIKSTVVLRELTNDKGTIVVVASISYDVEAMTAKQLVATMGNAVVLS